MCVCVFVREECQDGTRVYTKKKAHTHTHIHTHIHIHTLTRSVVPESFASVMRRPMRRECSDKAANDAACMPAWPSYTAKNPQPSSPPHLSIQTYVSVSVCMSV